MIRYRRFIFYNQHLQPSFELDKLRFEATRIVSSSPCSKLVVDTKLLHLQLFKHLLTLSTTANTSDLFDPILTFWDYQVSIQYLVVSNANKLSQVQCQPECQHWHSLSFFKLSL